MAEKILLPPRPTFEGQVVALKQRMEDISGQNRMARLLNQNFNTWLSNSSMSAMSLTQELDKDKDGVISGDEFSEILAKMTGEQPPEWVVELMFSFVDAEPASGIPVADWMAFLAANGLEIPDSMFELDIPLVGTITSDGTDFIVEQPINLIAKFSLDVESYTITVIQDGVELPESFTTPVAQMDYPNSDAFILEPDAPGKYTITLSIDGNDLDLIEILVLEIEEEDWPEEEEVVEVVEENPSSRVESVPSNELSGFITMVENTRLRSEAMEIIKGAPAYTLNGLVEEVNTTLLGESGYKNGITAKLLSVEGSKVQVMMKHTETPSLEVGKAVSLKVQPIMWEIAVRELVCKEL
ncbi:MAG TPA: hypothetical protein QF401_07390 [Candidatus Poseidoniaceae archaeon]|nr:hypothetical protein [Candidatus Poseidoniaceae archaeon]